MKRILIALVALWTGIQTVSAQIPELKPVKDLSEELTPVQKKNKWGFANGKGKMIIKAVFEYAEEFEPVTSPDGTTMKVARIKAGGKWGYITRENVYLITPEYDTISRFDNNALVVGQLGPYLTLMGVQTAQSPKLKVPVLVKKVLQVNLGELCEFNEHGFAWASYGGKWGLLDNRGEWALPCEYDLWTEFGADSKYGVTREMMAGIVTRDCKILIPAEYDRISTLPNNCFLVEKDNLLGVKNPDGSELFPVVYPVLYWKEDLGFVAGESGKFGRFTAEGKQLYPVLFPEVPDRENSGYIENVDDGIPGIYIAGDKYYTVKEYDDKLFGELGEDAYKASDVIPDWLKGHLNPETVYVTLPSNMPEPVAVPEGFDGRYSSCAKLRFKCGASLADVVLEDEYESIDPQVKLWDGGDKVYVLLHAVEELWVLYVYESATRRSRIFPVTGNMVCDPVHSVFADTGVWGDAPLAEFTPMNITKKADISVFPILRYRFRSWAGEPFVSLCASISGELLPVSAGETIEAGRKMYGFSDQYCDFHVHICDPAANGIARYELLATEHVYGTPDNPDELVAKTPVVAACGYIGLTRPFFTQPLFYEAKDFSNGEAMVRVGDEWLTLTEEELAASDPFVQPDR